jgi:hypothetical protein
MKKPAGKAAKFVFVTAPLSIFGWELNKRLFSMIRVMWTRTVNPACPMCEQGVLVIHRDIAPVLDQNEQGQASRELYPWACSHCNHAMLEVADARKVKEVADRIRLEQAKSMFSEIEMKERDDIARKHKWGSRLFFVVSTLVFINFIRMLANGSTLILTLNWASFAFMFWVFGMKRSYRAWQVLSGHIFERGAFWHWLRHEKWLV